MVTLLKNQLLKHLSRFTKNLNPEQISLSALRGSGELQDLTLDEDLLTDLLELPGWLRLTSAKCNRATFRIQWTKLKTVPIMLNLDEVHVALEVCPEPRTPQTTAATAGPLPTKYSYIHKVIDGISVSVNSVQIDFNCDAFTSTVQISRITVESRTPQWQKGDLRLTRIKSPDTGQLLIFKQLEWQTARVEARPRSVVTSVNMPPLRLLAGPAHCRIVIKKRLSDSQVLGSRLVIQPEPLAWALTDGQLRAALACAAALSQPVRKATAAATRAKAVRKMQTDSVHEAPLHASTLGGERDALARLFAKHDVKETSYHLLAPRIDLHLCDDVGLGRSEKPSLSNGGALQVTLLSLQADFFPYHKASSDRRHWRGYREAATPHNQWLSQSLSTFCGAVLEFMDSRSSSTPKSSRRGTSEGDCTRLANGVNPADRPHINNNVKSSGSSTRSRVMQQVNKLMTTCLVLRIDDFTVYKVSTGSKGKEAPKAMVCAEKATLPGDAGLLHAEMTHLYYPGDDQFPVPPPKLYVQLSPIRVSVDVESLIWLGAFLPHVAQALAETAASGGVPLYMDVKCEAIMPKIVLEAGSEHVPQQRDRPRELQICAARASITNVREAARTEGPGTREDLAKTIEALRNCALVRGQFPEESNDIDPINERFISHANNLDDLDRGTAIRPELLWCENRSVWCARVEPAWADFCGIRAVPTKTSPFLDAVPLTAWICTDDAIKNIWCVARVTSLVGIQLNHYQMLLLLRQAEKLAELTSWMAHDNKRQNQQQDSTIVVGVAIPQAEITMLLPSCCPGQGSSRESVPLDTSSINDLKMAGSEVTVTQEPRSTPSIPHPLENIDYIAPPIEEVTPPSPGPFNSLSNNFGGFSSMRRGFNSLVTSIDSALTRDDSRSDAASTASSDSERYVIVGLADSPDDADAAFREFEQGHCVSNVEVAAEVIEEARTSTPSEKSVSSSCRRRDLISTCTWRVRNINLTHQSLRGTTAVRVIADNVTVDECAAIPWDEFQAKFSMRSRAWSETPGELSRSPEARVAMRLVRKSQDKGGDSSTVPAPYEELLEARIKDLSLTLNMSSAMALSEFIEDEVVVAPMPLEVLLSNISMRLLEDRPSRSISSPHSPPPLLINLDSLKLTRDNRGVVKIGPVPVEPIAAVHAVPSPCSPELLEAKEKLARLSKENEELRKRLAHMSRIAEDNRELRARVEETNTIRHIAHAAQQETAAVLADKRALLDTVKSLQDQLSSALLGRGGGKR